ncbi:hypothetical protein GGI07_005864 [Coemansia sp. Benny D115]|nr:hypothetical protein GGI07_005864 [Coemansia sp. Benny D115]
MRFNKFVLATAVAAISLFSVAEGACTKKVVNKISSPTQDKVNSKAVSLASKGSNGLGNNKPTSSANVLGNTGPTGSTSAATEVVTLEELRNANPDNEKPGFCDDFNKEFPESKGQCVSNADAIDPINKAIAKYNITRRGEIVAVIATMLMETGGWTENTNHYGAEPGQGTRCMMMWEWVSVYAKELYPEEYAKLMGDYASDPDSAPDDLKETVRDLVLQPDDTFGSGFWYLVTAAPKYHGDESKLRDGNLEDFKDYVINGVIADWDADRQSWWEATNKNIMLS